MKKDLRLQEAVPALTLLLYLLISEPPAVWLLFFSALATHELGHLTAFRFVREGAPRFCFEGVGTRLTPSLPLLPAEEAAVAVAGPLFNVAFALFALRFGKGGFFLLFAVVHLLFGLSNLLPFGACDGERLLRLLLPRLCPRCADAVTALLGSASLALLFYFSLFIYYLTGNGLCGVFFSLFFLLREKHPTLSRTNFP